MKRKTTKPKKPREASRCSDCYCLLRTPRSMTRHSLMCSRAKRPARKETAKELLDRLGFRPLPKDRIGDPWDLPHAQTQSEPELRIGLSAARALVNGWGACDARENCCSACAAIAILRQQVEEHDGRGKR